MSSRDTKLARSLGIFFIQASSFFVFKYFSVRNFYQLIEHSREDVRSVIFGCKYTFLVCLHLTEYGSVTEKQLIEKRF